MPFCCFCIGINLFCTFAVVSPFLSDCFTERNENRASSRVSQIAVSYRCISSSMVEERIENQVEWFSKIQVFYCMN